MNLRSRRAGPGIASCTEGQVVSRMARSLYHPQENYGSNIWDYQKRKKNRIFHVNMLATWESPTAACLVVEEATEETVTGEELSNWPTEPDSTEPEIEPDLSEQQKQELWCAVKKHRMLFQDTPGRTNLIKIWIEMDDAALIHLPPYRNEILQLLRAKIIKPSMSPWASPVVLVLKRDGSLHLCVDYNYLNCVTKPDPYPMPRVDDLQERLGQAKYISTLNLWETSAMPFGHVGAPAVFQCLMNTVLQTYQNFRQHTLTICHCLDEAD